MEEGRCRNRTKARLAQTSAAPQDPAAATQAHFRAVYPSQVCEAGHLMPVIPDPQCAHAHGRHRLNHQEWTNPRPSHMEHRGRGS